ncbi:hypothetical protein BDV24DRAFT_148744 [Aspergillus arachidicola]|uniref:GST N-terminal domain-containing protein n=1 Tax=Aspergillus arachidicola TaxID=656916 RepID=A0A5N6YHJ3_9EURO|nr:hypothetical protein BDV24DRAFT_148744 [Aspergillus arachidicola]
MTYRRPNLRSITSISVAWAVGRLSGMSDRVERKEVFAYKCSLRLFLKDAGVEFNDVRYPYDDTWPAASAVLKEKGLSVTGRVPVLEYEGKILTQHLAILRYLARELGEYDGNTSLEKYFLDAVADVYNDWRIQWVNNLGNVTDKFRNEVVPDYYNVLGRFYAQQEGPYLLGERITYTDFVVYQSIDNDSQIGTLPPCGRSTHHFQ